ncbi:hypothetical protein [Amycolatopsis solani]|uniref:hypothetical protein n=1 Tax=Amycolatopsis solani TaxID=3028615 RepID=UPI00296E75B2|nr:hypothetical protein [Amycolatopsis sp. MEP2-6]
MASKRLRTANYDQRARARLGDAVTKAREAGGWQYRTDFVEAAKQAGIKLNVRSMELLENGEPGVGQSVLFGVARILPNWTEDTPRIVLEDGPIPPTSGSGSAHLAVVPDPEPEPGPDLLDDVERKLWAITDLSEDERWSYIYQHRARTAQRFGD